MPGPDAGVPSRDAGRDAPEAFDAAGIDASQAMPCLAGDDVFYVVGDGGYPGISGTMSVDGSVGTWSGSDDGEMVLQLSVQEHGSWAFAAGGDVIKGIPLAVGSYVSTGDDHSIYAQVEAASGGCPAVPTGSFTIAELASSGGDQASLTRLLAWFDLACPAGGTVKGCVSYGR
jgi:hypothetical protein